jgi:ABC-type nitrate/sulfonate/bicarbonate transport system ATPase subunit
VVLRGAPESRVTELPEGVDVVLEGVSKSFTRRDGREIRVLRDVGFTADNGEFVSVIGPSGCGKSTLFALIAELLRPDAGTVAVVRDPSNGRPDVAHMPQRDLLLPWRSVRRNVTLPLEIGGMGVREAERRADQLFPVFGLEGFEDSYPFTMSGGMRQRAALMRTVIRDARVLLLDEPFGALDSLTRGEMQDFMLEIWDRFRRTVIFITHDIREAIYLSDRVNVMTARPATIRETFRVPLPRPRAIEMITSPDFVALEAELLRALREESLHMHELEARET